MCLIHGTNIFVDDFKFSRPFRNNYIYFLTHFHADHYQGITPSWRREKIYCSAITKKLLLNRYPNLTNVEELDLDIPHTIYLNENKTLFVRVTLLDANHCIGSVMLLFEGYMGTILHTGDFRFTKRMFEENTILYPPRKSNPDNEECAIHIDELILDDTYCDPIFKFPTRKDAFKSVIGIIESTPGKRVCIALDTLGKEELLVHLANHYKTKIILNEKRFTSLRLAEYYLHLFTSDHEEGFIEVIRKDETRRKLNEGCVVIIPTGWCNQHYFETEPYHYMVGYSLHSNYEEIYTFVKSIKPGKLSTQWQTKKKISFLLRN